LQPDNDGMIGSRKSVNIPGVKITLPSLTEKDKTFIELAARNDIEFIASLLRKNRSRMFLMFRPKLISIRVILR